MTALRGAERRLPTLERAFAASLPRRAVLVGALAAAWCVATLTFVVVHDAAGGLTFTGAYAGLFPDDQLRYLAWIREAGLHLLIADPTRPGAPHVYLQPLFVISGLLWRAGLSIQAAYLVWTPVAIAVLIWGYAQFTRRFLARTERAVALGLGLLFFSPLIPLFDWGGIVDANGANYLVIAGGHAAPYWQAWGYLPTVIALGLQPPVLLGLESLLNRGVRTSRIAWVTLAGLLVAWLQPWGGIELVLVVLALLVLRRRDPRRRVLIPRRSGRGAPARLLRGPWADRLCVVGVPAARDGHGANVVAAARRPPAIAHRRGAGAEAAAGAP